MIEHKPEWEFKQWVSALRAETIRITCDIVVLYLEKTLSYAEVPPLKNGLHSICKVIRQHRRGVKIFICNLRPRPSKSPLCRKRMETEFILVQAVRSINRIMGKIHFMSVHEHFVSREGKILRPIHKYFTEDKELTTLGCMILHECIMREAGIKNYWFQ